jgi:hypothetical protein
MTALALAVQQGKFGVVNLLLEKGAINLPLARRPCLGSCRGYMS